MTGKTVKRLQWAYLEHLWDHLEQTCKMLRSKIRRNEVNFSDSFARSVHMCIFRVNPEEVNFLMKFV